MKNITKVIFRNVENQSDALGAVYYRETDACPWKLVRFRKALLQLTGW